MTPPKSRLKLSRYLPKIEAQQLRLRLVDCDCRLGGTAPDGGSADQNRVHIRQDAPRLVAKAAQLVKVVADKSQFDRGVDGRALHQSAHKDIGLGGDGGKSAL